MKIQIKKIVLLPFGSDLGAHQMALDQWMLEEPGSYLRFYQWTKPTLSLGRNQALDPEMDLKAARAAGVEVVRRATGGQAVLHHLELTYSFASSTPPFPKSILESYQAVRQPILSGLARMGLAAQPGREGKFRPTGSVCFSQTQGHEVSVEGKKLVGSAQRRKGERFLQHGSILLDRDLGLLGALWPQKPRASWAEETITLKEALGHLPKVEKLVELWAEEFAAAFGAELEAAAWPPGTQEWVRTKSPGFVV